MLYLKCNKNRKRVKKMKKLNKKGFTLIELLAVITIMGVLMIVAIPTVSRTIENTRRDTFLDTAKQYVNGIKTMWVSDSLECQTTAGGATYTLASGLTTGSYYVKIDSSKTSGIGSGTEYPIILESGGKSSWASKNVKGFVKVTVAGSDIKTQTYSIRLTDGTHGIVDTNKVHTNLKRGNVVVNSTDAATEAGTGATLTLTDDPTATYNGARKVTSARFCKEV